METKILFSCYGPVHSALFNKVFKNFELISILFACSTLFYKWKSITIKSYGLKWGRGGIAFWKVFNLRPFSSVKNLLCLAAAGYTAAAAAKKVHNFHWSRKELSRGLKTGDGGGIQRGIFSIFSIISSRHQVSDLELFVWTREREKINCFHPRKKTPLTWERGRVHYCTVWCVENMSNA
jgi:hypothetical protein